jgi:hypothetical protein
MITTRYCVACGGTDLDDIPAEFVPFIVARAKILPHCNTLHCLECDCVFSDVRFNDAQMDRIYSDYRGEDYTIQRETFEPGYNARNEELKAGLDYLQEVEAFIGLHIQRLADTISVLDWGGDTGINTPFRETCARLDIYDIGGVSPLYGVMVQAPHPPYDLVILSSVLEHVPNPLALLEQVRDTMDDAILYVEVPNDPSVIVSKKLWHEHINFFTLVSLHKLAERSGIKIISYQLGNGGASHQVILKGIA